MSMLSSTSLCTKGSGALSSPWLSTPATMLLAFAALLGCRPVCLLALDCTGPQCSSSVSKLSAEEDQRESADLQDIYLHTVRSALTGDLGQTPNFDGEPYSAGERQRGHNGCKYCQSCAGTASVKHFGELLLDAWQRGVRGDVLEAGTWHGGMGIYAAALMAAYPNQAGDRRVVLADTFGHFPRSTSSASEKVWESLDIGIGRAGVEANFKRYGLWSPRVSLIEGDAATSLPHLRRAYLEEGRSLSVLRIDVDVYESYLDVLYPLYGLVNVGGYVICDDCACIADADRAVLGFRQHHRLWDQVALVPGSECGVFWRKRSDMVVDWSLYQSWMQARKATCDVGEASQEATCQMQPNSERLRLLQLETTSVSSLDDIKNICRYTRGIVIVWLVPLSFTSEQLTEREMNAMFIVQEAMRPMASHFCAQLLTIDLGAPFDGPIEQLMDELQAVTWHRAESNVMFMAIGAACGPRVGFARDVLHDLYDVVSKSPRSEDADLHLAQKEFILRSWLTDAGACPEWATSAN